MASRRSRGLRAYSSPRQSCKGESMQYGRGRWIGKHWEKAQTAAFTQFVNSYLKQRDLCLNAPLIEAFADGITIISFVEILCASTINKRYVKRPKTRIERMANTGIALSFLQDTELLPQKNQIIKLSDFFVDTHYCNQHILFAFLWTIFKKMLLRSLHCDEDPIFNNVLIEWCKQMTKDYKEIAIENFTASFQDGNIFLALIHKYDPTIFSYEQVIDETNRITPQLDQRLHKVGLALNLAQKHMKIPKILKKDRLAKGKYEDHFLRLYIGMYLRAFLTREEKIFLRNKIDPYKKDLALTFRNQTFSDYTLSYKGRNFYLHKCVIHARCKIFLNFSQINQWLQSEGVTAEVLGLFLEFLYTEELNLESRTLNEVYLLLKCSRYFGLKPLEIICGQWAKDNFVDDDISSFMITLGISSEADKDTVINWHREQWISFILEVKFIDEMTKYCLSVLLMARQHVFTFYTDMITFSTIREDMKQLLHTRTHYDLSIYVKGTKFRVHKAIIAARCPFFRSMFNFDVNSGQNNLKQKVLKHDAEMDATAFAAFLNYLYTGNLSCSPDSCIQIMSQIHFYGMSKDKHLKKLLKTSLAEFTNMETCFELLDASIKYHLPKLRRMAVDFIVANYKKCARDPRLHRLSQEATNAVLHGVTLKLYEDVVPDD